MSNNIYPPLSTLITTDRFPNELSFLSNAIDSVLEKISFKDYYPEKSIYGDCSIYQITLILEKSLAIPLFSDFKTFM